MFQGGGDTDTHTHTLAHALTLPPLLWIEQANVHVTPIVEETPKSKEHTRYRNQSLAPHMSLIKVGFMVSLIMNFHAVLLIGFGRCLQRRSGFVRFWLQASAMLQATRICPNKHLVAPFHPIHSCHSELLLCSMKTRAIRYQRGYDDDLARGE